MKYSAFYCLIECQQQATMVVNYAPSCGGTTMSSCNYSVARRLCHHAAYSNKQCTPPPEGEARACDRIVMQKEYVPQQVMCVTFTSISMSADIAGVRRSFVQTCSSRWPAAVLGVLVPPATIIQATRFSPCPPLPPLSLSPLSLHSPPVFTPFARCGGCAGGKARGARWGRRKFHA
jgi:hypothetical protein